MAPSDRLLLYTDGLTEARDPTTAHFYSPHQIIQAVSTETTVTEAVARLRDAVLDWSGGALHDDIALVLIEFRAEQPTLETREVPATVAAPVTTTRIPQGAGSSA